MDTEKRKDQLREASKRFKKRKELITHDDAIKNDDGNHNNQRRETVITDNILTCMEALKDMYGKLEKRIETLELDSLRKRLSFIDE